MDMFATLERGTLYRFSDWPNDAVPNWRAGVYTIWDAPRLLYVGMAGRGLAPDAHLSDAAAASTRPKGLRDRLRSHASGRRSGDQFCVYVFDRLVLPNLTQHQIAAAAEGALLLDGLTCAFIRERLAYRFAVATNSTEAHEVERVIRRSGLSGALPLLNPGGSDTGGATLGHERGAAAKRDRRGGFARDSG